MRGKDRIDLYLYKTRVLYQFKKMRPMFWHILKTYRRQLCGALWGRRNFFGEPLNHCLFLSFDRCMEPEQMRGRKLHELEVHNYHMRCLDTAENHPEKDGNLLIGMLVGVLIAVPITILLLLLLRNSRFGARFFSRGPAAYSRTFYSRTETGDNWVM